MTAPARRPRVIVPLRDANCLRVLAKMDFCKDMGEPLAELYAKLDTASVVDSESVPRSVVTMGSRVLLFDRETEARRDITLVYPWNDAPYAGRLSVLSPLGTAILGVSIGATVRYASARAQVLDVLFQPRPSHP